MSRYRRNYIAGGTFFFTVKLADPKSRLLVEHINLLREAYASVQKRYPFETVAICVMPNHLHAVWTLPDGDSKRSLYNPPAACVAPPPTLPVDSCVGCVPSGTHALFGLYRSGRLKANAFRRPFLPNFIRYPAALCVLVRETLDSTQQAVACINRPTACVATPHTLPAT